MSFYQESRPLFLLFDSAENSCFFSVSYVQDYHWKNRHLQAVMHPVIV